MPFQGVDFRGNRTRRDAAGWYVLPLQGEGLTDQGEGLTDQGEGLTGQGEELISSPNGSGKNITRQRKTFPDLMGL
ncbi:MAG: hypothetical protein LBG58_09740 [Planctomycetaceae bacterium]|nr:hypothetical protein [Planctomycetaceae bacterium]